MRRTGRFVFAGCEHVYVSFATSTAIAALTATEAEVARMAASGASTSAIARTRRVSERTVANQLASIYRKLGLTSRLELAARFWAR